MDVTIIHPAEASATPAKVHLADEQPVAAGADADQLRPVTGGACALHVGVEPDGLASFGDRTARQVGRRDVWIVEVLLVHPPVAVTKPWTHGEVGGVWLLQLVGERATPQLS